MTKTRSKLTRRSSRFRLTATALIAACSVLGVAALDDSAIAATKTTKTTKKATKSKVKTTTTKRRKPPAPAKGAKRAGALWQPNAGRTGPAAPLNFDPSPKSGDVNNPSAPNEAAAYALIEPTNVFSILVVGTDARPGERPEKTRADSIHLFTYNAVLKKGALVGFPRDSYVKAPSGETRKINEIMSTAGPDAFLAAVNGTSGIATKRWILTGFDGFTKIVDGVGGVVVKVDPAINDVDSGAQFAAGWFQFNGKAALAYSRARKALVTGDFGRSANQSKLIVAGFGRLRESTDNIRALLNWVLVMRKNTVSNVKATEWMYLAQVARSIDPVSITSVVLSGVPENVDGSEVIRLDEANLKTVFTDLADGVLGN